MTDKTRPKAKPELNIGKQELLVLLSHKLGCTKEDVSFLFTEKANPPSQQELTIPDGRS